MLSVPKPFAAELDQGKITLAVHPKFGRTKILAGNSLGQRHFRQTLSLLRNRASRGTPYFRITDSPIKMTALQGDADGAGIEDGGQDL